MCLRSVSKTFQPNNRMKVGYKVFKKIVKRNRDIEYNNIFFKIVDKILMGNAYTVYNDIMREEIALNGKRYMPFFHIFNTVDAAKEWSSEVPRTIWKERNYVICMVIAWDIRARGTTSTMWQPRPGEYSNVPTFIAKNYRLMEELPWQR